MRCASSSKAASPTWGASDRANEDALPRALARCSRSPTAWAARAPARSRREMAVETLGEARRRRARAREQQPRRRRRGGQPAIYELAQEDASRAGMGTTMTAVLVRRRRDARSAHVGDSRALPAARRRARAAHPRPLARRGVRAPGQAHARGGGGPPAALDHHARARARSPTSRSTLHLPGARTATSTCSARTGSRDGPRGRRRSRSCAAARRSTRPRRS